GPKTILIGYAVLPVLLAVVILWGVRSRPEADRMAILMNQSENLRQAGSDWMVIDDSMSTETALPRLDFRGFAGAGEPPRVRELFPETLLWRPELVTDDQGRASLDLELADSITTW